jgi:hypothetical protein
MRKLNFVCETKHDNRLDAGGMSRSSLVVNQTLGPPPGVAFTRCGAFTYCDRHIAIT